jgi:hypothetical protein
MLNRTRPFRNQTLHHAFLRQGSVSFLMCVTCMHAMCPTAGNRGGSINNEGQHLSLFRHQYTSSSYNTVPASIALHVLGKLLRQLLHCALPAVALDS